MDIKLFFFILSLVVGMAAFYPYIRDTLQGKTQPHIYTWFIWVITQGVATAGAWYGGGGWGAVNLMVGTMMVVLVFLLSFRYGTKNITTADTLVLVAALFAIVAWLGLRSPLLAVVLAAAIDFAGYIPSYRKSFAEPWSETVTTWLGFALATIFAILALDAYNPLTLTYLAVIAVANLILAILCLVRRPFVPRPTA